jgi:hypothetical protein
VRTGVVLFFIFISQSFLLAQSVSVTGKLKDKDHLSISGALVEWTDNPNFNTITDSSGFFVLSLPAVKLKSLFLLRRPTKKRNTT